MRYINIRLLLLLLLLAQRKNEMSSFTHLKVIEGFQNLKKIGHVTLTTPLLGSFTMRSTVLAVAYLTKEKPSVKIYPFKS